MSHAEAIGGLYSERFLLNELNPAKRETFLEHYFECEECGRGLLAAALFVAVFKALRRRRRWPLLGKLILWWWRLVEWLRKRRHDARTRKPARFGAAEARTTPCNPS